MPNHAPKILRLLRFAGLMLLLGSAAPASAQTVAERVKNDPSFRIYPVIFGVTATTNSKPPVVRVVESFTYFFYVPEYPNVVVSDLDKPLDKQP
jgi:hypothetical protein